MPVLVQEVDSAFLFRSKATQEGVRLVHLNLQFSGQQSDDKPLTNRVRGPYCKLRIEFFPVDLWPKREARGP